MKTRLIGATLLLTGIAGLSTIASAATGKIPSQACFNSFKATITSVNPGQIRFINNGVMDSESEYTAGIYRYDLAAYDASGALVASATCKAREQDTIVAFVSEHVDFRGAMLAHR
jgi:hypothetical protein